MSDAVQGHHDEQIAAEVERLKGDLSDARQVANKAINRAHELIAEIERLRAENARLKALADWSREFAKDRCGWPSFSSRPHVCYIEDLADERDHFRASYERVLKEQAQTLADASQLCEERDAAVASHQKLKAYLEAAERVLIDEAGVDGDTLAECAKELLNREQGAKYMLELLRAHLDAAVASEAAMRAVLTGIVAEGRHEYATGASSISAMIQRAERALASAPCERLTAALEPMITEVTERVVTLCVACDSVIDFCGNCSYECEHDALEDSERPAGSVKVRRYRETVIRELIGEEVK